LQVRPYRSIPASAGLDEELASFRALEGGGPETLLVWEAERPCIVLPRGGAAEFHLPADAGNGVPVLRRESGGGAVVLGPGCLNYALVVSLEKRPRLLDVEGSYAEILGALVAALRLPGVTAVGSDLVLDDRKFGGNAQRRSRRALLHHGTILYGFDARGRFRTPYGNPSGGQPIADHARTRNFLRICHFRPASYRRA
jgi:lipoate-protein ligase A